MIVIYIVARIKGLPAQPWVGFKTLLRSSFTASWGLMLIVIVLGSIYGGICSPTEAAAISAVYAFFIAIFVYRDMGPLKGIKWKEKKEDGFAKLVVRNLYLTAKALPLSFIHKDTKKVLLDAAKVSIMLLFIIGNAMLFAHVLTTERIPHQLTAMIVEWGLPAWGFLIVVNILLLIAGNFMEPSAILLIMAPILFPIAVKLGIDPIHLGIIMVVNMEIGMITPPVGLNLFVTAGITGESITWVLRAALPWLMILLVFLVMITYIPQISLWLPNYIDHLKGY
jgi:C4-dicarboxylate transporter DctM subunit